MRPLVEMQAAELRVRALEAEITLLPRRLQEAEQGVKQAAAALEANGTAMQREEASRRRMESDIADLKARAAKYVTQTNTVTTPAQLAALEYEIAFAQQQVGEIELQELDSLERTDQLQAAAPGLQSAVDAAKKVMSETSLYVRKKSGDLRAALEQARQDHQRWRREAAPEWLARFDTVAKSRKTGVAEAIEGECQGCHMRLRPHHWNQLRDGADIKCESCGRMLYYDEGNDRQLASKAAGRLDIP